MKVKSVLAFLALCLVGTAAAMTARTIGRGNETKTKEQHTVVHAYIAASLSKSMEQVAEEFEKKYPDIQVEFNADSSGTLQKQIEEGADCDLFFSAAEKQMNSLKEEGLVKEETIHNVLKNEVVLIGQKGNSTDVTDFTTITKAKNIALAGESVPVGQYAREILTNLHQLEDVLKMEVNECTNVTNVLTAVAEGSNEVGIVYATDAKTMEDKVVVIAKAPEGSLTTSVNYPVALVKKPNPDAKTEEAAQRLLEFIMTDEAKEIFTSFGFSLCE